MKRIYICLFTIAIFSISSVANAAFCSLRDPVKAIKTLYPESTSFKYSVKVIAANIRNQVQELLPPNTLHFSELGKHTLYIAYKEDSPIGYVHVRSEESRWGLVEIAWAIDLNLKVRDFQFQRCRNRQKTVVEDAFFKAQLKDKTYQEFTHMLATDGLSLNTSKINVPDKAKGLAEIVIRCGMKTLLVTELAWSDEIHKNRLSSTANNHFDGAKQTYVVTDVMDDTIESILNKAFDGAQTGIDRSSVMVAKVYDDQKKVIGLVYEGQLVIDRKPANIHWAMTTEGEIINVDNLYGWQQTATRNAFENTIGNRYELADHCNNRAELLTLQAVLTSKHIYSL